MVPAAGRGERLGSGTAKAFVEVAGEPLLLHAVRRLLAAGSAEGSAKAVGSVGRTGSADTANRIDTVVVAAPPDLVTHACDLLAGFGDRVCVLAGGSQRTESVRLALAAARRRGPVEVVLVHDAARAFAPAELVEAVVAAVRSGANAVVPVLPVTDTVKHVDESGRILSTVDRSTLRAVQTPQGFRADVLVRAHELASGDATDDAGLVERLGEPVHTVPGDPLAFKVTTPFDLLVAEVVARR